MKIKIDYILTNNCEIIKDVSVLNKFHTGSDHRLVGAEVIINTKAERRKLVIPTKYVNIEQQLRENSN